jgi:6-pyruvoyl-tetrahydropterin synthase
VVIVFIAYSAKQSSIDLVDNHTLKNTEVKSYLFIRPKVKSKPSIAPENEATNEQIDNNIILPEASQVIQKQIVERNVDATFINTDPVEIKELSPTTSNSKNTILSLTKDLGNQSIIIKSSNFAERSMSSYFQEHNRYKENEMSKIAAEEFRQRQNSPVINTKRTIDTSPTSALNIELIDEKLVANKVKNVNCDSGVNKALVILVSSTGGAVRCTPKPDIQSFIDKHQNK